MSISQQRSLPGTQNFNKLWVLSLVIFFLGFSPAVAATVTISGTLYSDEGTTAVTTGPVIKLAISSTTAPVTATTTSNGSGVYSFTVEQNDLGIDTSIITFVDASSTLRATTITKATSSESNVINLDLYKDNVIIRQEGSTSTTLSDLAVYDSTNDTDLQYTASSTLDSLNILNGQELHIWNGDTFVNAASTTLSGSFHNDGGTFTHNSGTTYLTGTGETISGSTTASSTLGNLTITGSYTASNNASTSDLTIESGGTFTAPSLLTVDGTYTNNGTFTHDSGTTYFTGEVGYDVSTASFVDSFSVGSEVAFPRGITFSSDGLKMFVMGFDDVNEYTLSTSFDVSTASFVDSFYVGSEETYPYDLAFSSDGLKMFVVGHSGDDVNEYTLSTAFDVSTASFVDSFSVASEDTVPVGVTFSSDGLKMFMLGYSGDDVNEYTLSTAFDVSTASFVDSFSVASEDNNPFGITFSSDGLKMFVVGSFGDDVNEYTLSTAFDVSTASFVDSFSIASEDTSPVGVTFSSDGLKMFVVGSSGQEVSEYTLSTAFSGTMVGTSAFNDVVVASSSGKFMNTASTSNLTIDTNSTLNISTNTLAIAGSYTNNGTFTKNNNGLISLTGSGETLSGTLTGTSELGNLSVEGSYTASNNASTSDLTIDSGGTFTAPSLLTVDGTYTNNGTFTHNNSTVYAGDDFYLNKASFIDSFSVASEETSPVGITFSSDGLKMFVVGSSGDDVNEYTLSTAFDVSTASFVDSFSVASEDNNPFGITFSSDGLKMFVVGSSGDDVNEYTLSTAFDVSTASFVDSFYVGSEETSPVGITFSSDGLKMFVVGSSGDDVNEYTLSTAFDVSTASFVDSFSVASEDNNPFGITFSSDGLKMFVVGSSGDDVNEYTLSTAFDVSTASFVDSFSIASEDTSPRGITFSSDGLKMFVVGSFGDDVNEYTLSTAFSGTMVGTSAFNDVVINGAPYTFNTSASTSDLTINTSSVLKIDGGDLSIAGSYTNNGTFTASTSEVIFSGTSAQTATGTMTGISAFYDLTVTNTSGTGATQSVIFGMPVTTTNTFTMVASTSAQFLAGATSTFENVDWQGSTDSEVWLRSSSDGTQWYLDIPGTQLDVDYVNVKDSGASSTVTAINSTDSTNNTNWSFGAAAVGSSTIANHDATQVSNAFNFQNKTNEPLFAFQLIPESGNATITELIITLSGAKKINTSDFSNITLYKDHDNDADYDANDEQVGGGGVMVLNGTNGTITFSTDFLSTTTQNYLVTADWDAPDNGSFLNINLYTAGVSAIDDNGAQTIYGSVDNIQHRRNNKSGGGGSSSQVGGSSPQGRTTVTGGTNEGGEQIGDDPNFKLPTAYSGDWNNGANAYDQTDGTYADTSTNNASSSFSNHSFSVPGSNTIEGVAVKLEVSRSGGSSETIDVELSWDGGTTWTSAKTTPTLTATDVVTTLGSPSDVWGRAWSPNDFSDANFRVRVTGNNVTGTAQIDALQVRVYHQAGGGGAGGGGAI